MAQRDSFPLVDRLVPGGLTDFLHAARPDQSFEDIAFTLRTEHDIEVSTETVRKWAKRVGAPEKNGAAA